MSYIINQESLELIDTVVDPQIETNKIVSLFNFNRGVEIINGGAFDDILSLNALF